jgi:hypothetical protein
VAEPAGDGRNVNAALNAARGEQMAQIVMGHPPSRQMLRRGDGWESLKPLFRKGST